MISNPLANNLEYSIAITSTAITEINIIAAIDIFLILSPFDFSLNILLIPIELINVVLNKLHKLLIIYQLHKYIF